MNFIASAIIGADIPSLQKFISNYWIVPAGWIVLFFYGKSNFNKPVYSIGGSQRATVGNLVQDLPLSKLRTMAPPMFTTSRARYRRYARWYVLILQATFTVFVFAPELVTNTLGLFGNAQRDFILHLPENVQQRGVWVLFVLTGVLSSLPGAKDIDTWLLSKLHQQAVIPYSAEFTAEFLYESNYVADQSIASEIIKGLRTHHLRQVVEGNETGELERNWFTLRCMNLSVKSLLFSNRNIYVFRTLKDDFDEVQECIEKLRERLYEHFVDQDKLISANVDDIDEFYSSVSNQSAGGKLRAQRRLFEVEVKALRFRLCRLCTLAIFATEPNTDEMNFSFKRIGFQVKFATVPGWHWDAIAKVALSILAAIVFPSFIYASVVEFFRLEPPPVMTGYVPSGINQIFLWGVSGATLHIMAIIITLKIKRHYARMALELRPSQDPQMLYIFISCYVPTFIIQILFLYINNIDVTSTFYWSILPAVTGCFASKYIDKSLSGKSISHIRAGKQAAVMFVLSALISAAVLIPNFHADEMRRVVFVFIGFASITAGCMGFAIGEIFQRTYSHSDIDTDIKMASNTLRDPNMHLIGDLLVERLQPRGAGDRRVVTVQRTMTVAPTGTRL